MTRFTDRVAVGAAVDYHVVEGTRGTQVAPGIKYCEGRKISKQAFMALL